MPLFPPGEAVCLFAQYAQAGRLPAHTRRYLAVLGQLGLRLHVALSGVTTVAAEDAEFLSGIGAEAWPRANTGLDFGAWADLLGRGCADRAAFVLLSNDSVFGPYGDLGAVVGRMQARRLDAWGMVESQERVWHLQSWFLMLRGACLAMPAVRRVFAQDFAAMTKPEIILHGELGLSVALQAEGGQLGSVTGPAGRQRRLLPANPSHFDWRPLLTTRQVPFLKVELLRDNPADIAWLGPLWRGVLGGLPANGVAEIEAALGAGFTPPRRAYRAGRRLLHCLLTQDRAAALRALVPAGRDWR